MSSQYKTFDSLAKSNITNITCKSDREYIIKNNPLVIIHNYAKPQSILSKYDQEFDSLTNKYSDKCTMHKYDIALYPCSEFLGNILSVPSTNFYVDGKILPEETIDGADINRVEETIERLLNPELELVEESKNSCTNIDYVVYIVNTLIFLIYVLLHMPNIMKYYQNL